MFSRCASVRPACALRSAATSAAYASEPAGAGGATGNCVGPVRTIILQVPAAASVDAGWAGGRSLRVGTSLLQELRRTAARTAVAVVLKVVLLEVEGVEQAGLHRRGLADVAAADDLRDAGPEDEARALHVVGRDDVEPGVVHPVRDEGRVL